jgi:hypothetical protein
VVERLVLKALECGYAAGLCCARKEKRILAAFGDAHRLEDKTIHVDQR